MSEKLSVLVIGAGMAGLSAAERLSRNGVNDFIVLEARDRIGGRVKVQELDGKKIHLGAQWIHQFCPENPLVQVAVRYGLVSEDSKITGGDMNPDNIFDNENIYTSSGELVSPDLVQKSLDIYKKICNVLELEEEYDLVDDSIKTVDQLFELISENELQKLKPSTGEEEFDLISNVLYGYKNALAHYVCGPLADCSFPVYTTGKGYPGDDIDLPFNLVQRIAEDLPKDCIKFNHVVTKIDWSNPSEVSVRVTVKDQLEKVFLAEHVICTLPIGVLQTNLSSLFTPALPDWKVKAIQNISPGCTSKYFISWEKPWRESNNTPIVLAWSKEELSSVKLPEEWFKGIMEISAEDDAPDKTLMLVWVGGTSSQVADKLPDDQILRDVGMVLRKFTSNPDIPDPDELIRECWTAEKFTLGAYSYPKVGADEDVFKKMGQPVPNASRPSLLFAGEATSKTLWSFLHGARLTGVVEADRVIKLKKSKS